MAAPYVIAIDPATNTGLCHGHVGAKPTLLAQRFRFGDESDEDLYGAATRFFASFLKDRSPDLVAIEAPIMAAWGKTNYQATSITRGLYAIFAGIVKCKGIPLLRADIGTWRKYFLGRGNLPGPEAKRQCVRLCRQLGWDAPTHDAAEAGGIWMYAGSTIAPRRVQRAEPLFVAPVAHASEKKVNQIGPDGTHAPRSGTDKPSGAAHSLEMAGK